MIQPWHLWQTIIWARQEWGREVNNLYLLFRGCVFGILIRGVQKRTRGKSTMHLVVPILAQSSLFHLLPPEPPHIWPPHIWPPQTNSTIFETINHQCNVWWGRRGWHDEIMQRKAWQGNERNRFFFGLSIKMKRGGFFKVMSINSLLLPSSNREEWSQNM